MKKKENINTPLGSKPVDLPAAEMVSEGNKWN